MPNSGPIWKGPKGQLFGIYYKVRIKIIQSPSAVNNPRTVTKVFRKSWFGYIPPYPELVEGPIPSPAHPELLQRPAHQERTSLVNRKARVLIERPGTVAPTISVNVGCPLPVQFPYLVYTAMIRWRPDRFAIPGPLCYTNRQAIPANLPTCQGAILVGRHGSRAKCMRVQSPGFQGRYRISLIIPDTKGVDDILPP